MDYIHDSGNKRAVMPELGVVRMGSGRLLFWRLECARHEEKKLFEQKNSVFRIVFSV